MRFVNIFAPYLYSVSFDDNLDAFSLLIAFLTDANQLEEYFHENQELLRYVQISVEEAVLQTSIIAEELYDYLDENRDCLDNIFEPLDRLGKDKVLYRMKYKRSWIRLYAIQIESKYFIIKKCKTIQTQKFKLAECKR